MKKHAYWTFGQGTLLVLFATLPLLFSNSSRAQICPTLSVSHTTVHQLSISDVDFEHFQSQSLLFTVAMGNTSESPISVQLHITLDVDLADGSRYPTAVDYLSQPFSVAPGGRTLTNLDLGSSAKDIKTESFNYTSEAKDKINDVLYGTGQFPAGRYIFNVSLVNCTGESFELILQNASRVELLAPRDGESTNQFPLFEFYQEGGSAEIVVAELLPGQSRQDAITRQPAMLDAQLNNQNSYFYAGGRPLEENKSYVWQVIGKSLIAGGSDAVVKSEIRSFTVSSASSGQSLDDALLRQLEEILGPKYKGVFDQIRAGQFKLTGKFSNNNLPVSQGEVLNLLNQLRDAVDTAELTFE